MRNQEIKKESEENMEVEYISGGGDDIDRISVSQRSVLVNEDLHITSLFTLQR